MSTEIKVSKRCPKCNWRILDKVTPTTGVIKLKCPRCKNEIEIDLSVRLNRQMMNYSNISRKG